MYSFVSGVFHSTFCLRFFHFIARGCSLVTWVMTCLGILQIMLIWICLCTKFCDNICAFVLGMCLGVRWLMYGAGTCLVCIDRGPNSFPEWLYQLSFPVVLYENGSCQHVVLPIPSLLNWGFQVNVQWYCILALISLSLMANAVELLFLCFWAVCCLTFLKCPFKSFAHSFFYWIVNMLASFGERLPYNWREYLINIWKP